MAAVISHFCYSDTMCMISQHAVNNCCNDFYTNMQMFLFKADICMLCLFKTLTGNPWDQHLCGNSGEHCTYLYLGKCVIVISRLYPKTSQPVPNTIYWFRFCSIFNEWGISTSFSSICCFHFINLSHKCSAHRFWTVLIWSSWIKSESRNTFKIN